MDDMVDTNILDKHLGYVYPVYLVDMTCANVAIDTNSTACHSVVRSCAVPVNKVKLWNQQHVLFCSFTIKETNFVLILVVHYLQFSDLAATTTNMTDLSRHEYDWQLW